MQNQIIQMLMNQLKIKNPQMFQTLEKAIQNKDNPMELFKQVTNGYTPEQMQSLMTQARNMGFPEDILNQIQNN